LKRTAPDQKEFFAPLFFKKAAAFFDPALEPDDI
jgi:hypothetical protein